MQHDNISVIAEAIQNYVNNPEDKWRQIEITRMQRVVNAVGDIADAVNGLDAEEVAQIMVEALGRQHKTLQSKVIESMVVTLYRYSGLPDNSVDARNEGARVLARDVVLGLTTVDPMYENEPHLMSI